ncbi:hypothetical protein ROA7450_00767 [Roseovarius albus]|uniref:Intracellular septation protein A n=2 Tax=Roseovarius albus TaxID=1247867 RepID=A0A1X6YHK0_9RHOB|nr:hypothetical protein ROA7450_00767 [Roseovarius albus]
MVSSLSYRLWNAISSVPPINPGNILPLVIMLILWVGLHQFQIDEDTIFVISVVVAEGYMIWRNLPTAAASLGTIQKDKPRLLRWPVMAVIGLIAIQLWLNDPLFTQRVLTGACLFVLIVMLLGLRREQILLDRVVPLKQHSGRQIKRVGLLRINALVLAIVITVNETLIASEPLAVWITVMPLLAILLHGFYWFAVLMVLPSEEAS